MVCLIKSRISSMAASGKRERDGMSAIASSTCVSVATKFISAATSALSNSSSFPPSSPLSTSLRKVCKALLWLGFVSFVFVWTNSHEEKCQIDRGRWQGSLTILNYRVQIMHNDTYSCKLSSSSTISCRCFSALVMRLNRFT
jgi:magnesium-transporting ATPase (P-type)